MSEIEVLTKHKLNCDFKHHKSDSIAEMRLTFNKSSESFRSSQLLSRINTLTLSIATTATGSVADIIELNMKAAVNEISD